MRLLTLTFLACCFSFPVFAQDDTATPDSPVSIVENTNQGPTSAGQQQPASHPTATTYSSGYEVRAKIHKYASFATLPLFATELALGQSLYNDPGGGKKTAHAIVGAGIGSLFAVNSVTGVWNLLEGSKDPVGRKRRLTHGILMLAADAGFFATFLNAPGSHELDFNQFNDSRSTHRTVAITSIGL